MKGSSEEHSKLVNDILYSCGGTEHCRIWKNHVGSARAFDNPDRVIKFGLPGSADIMGILKGGKVLAIECKTGQASQTKQQKTFMRMINGFGGVYILARPGMDILSIIKHHTKEK